MSTNDALSEAYGDLPKPDTNNATTIDWQKVPKDEYWETDHLPRNKRKYWKFQNQNNSGQRNGRWQNRPYETYRINRDLIENLLSKIRTHPNQRARAIGLITRLDLQKMGIPAERVAVAICAYVIHHAEDDPRYAYPAKGHMDRIADEVRSLQKSEGITDKQLRKTYHKVQHLDGRMDPPDVVHDKYEIDTNPLERWQAVRADLDDGWL